jgi:hypothetical protein
MPKGKINAPTIPSPNVATVQQSGGFLDSLLLSVHEVNMNPYVLGVAYILLNLGGRFMVLSVSPAQEAFLQNIIFRPLLLFAIMFIGTRNLVVAFWMTLAVIVALHYLFNENSSWYLLRDWTTALKTQPVGF